MGGGVGGAGAGGGGGGGLGPKYALMCVFKRKEIGTFWHQMDGIHEMFSFEMGMKFAASL